MAKKNSQAEAQAEDAAPLDGQWVESVWNGRQMLTCRHCQWDTLEGQAAANDHVRACPRCAPQAPAPASNGLILVADRYGNERPMAEEE